MSQELIFTPDARSELLRLTVDAPGVAIITDTNVARLVLPRLALPARWPVLTIAAGDENKTLVSARELWQQLTDMGATRHWTIINIGGGVVTDLGGFVGATFKRGVRFINVPTTLLGAVDAAVGGKTGINFAGLKNEIGVFAEAEVVVFDAALFDTLPKEEWLSGEGEMLKHALLEGDLERSDGSDLLERLRRNVEIKRRIVVADPHESGLRKALNLGHTAGHAFEALALEKGRPMAHGVAVAHGLVVALILSHILLEEPFPSQMLHSVAQHVAERFPAPTIVCDDYPRLIELMRHDKKNADASEIRFTLLARPGEVRLDRTATEEQITTAFDIMRDLLC